MSASKKDPAFLFYPKDWQDGTRSFYPAEKGIYIDLLAYQHQHGYIPADVNRLAVICGLGVNTFLPLWETVSQKFVPNGNQMVDQLVNERLMAEMGLRKENAHKNFVSGVFASLCKKSKASQSAIYKIKREFKVDDYTSFDREMVTERLTEWFTKRLPFLENENENGNEDVLGNNSKEGEIENLPPSMRNPSGPKIPAFEDVHRVFLSNGGTQEQAKAFFDKYEATGWYLKGSPVVNWVALVGSFISNWQEFRKNKQQTKTEKFEEWKKQMRQSA